MHNTYGQDENHCSHAPSTRQPHPRDAPQTRFNAGATRRDGWLASKNSLGVGEHRECAAQYRLEGARSTRSGTRRVRSNQKFSE